MVVGCGEIEPPAVPDEPLASDVEQIGSELTSGDVFTLKAVHSGKCVDVAGVSTADGGNVHQWDCHGLSNQQFRIEAASGGHTVVALHSGKCLDVYRAGMTSGTNVQQWRCNGQTNQRWRLVSRGNNQYQLQAAHSGKCLDVAGSSTVRGANIQQWTCADRSNQRFTLARVSGPSPGTPPNLVWRQANLTYFTSYPEPGSEECVKYNGCTWAGKFAFLAGKQPESWVMANNIAAVHSKDAGAYKLKTLRVRQGTRRSTSRSTTCARTPTATAVARRTAVRPASSSTSRATPPTASANGGVVEWACLDCN